MVGIPPIYSDEWGMVYGIAISTLSNVIHCHSRRPRPSRWSRKRRAPRSGELCDELSGADGAASWVVPNSIYCTHTQSHTHVYIYICI